MEPVSTLIVAAAFLIPSVSTKRIVWEDNEGNSPKVVHVENKYTNKLILPLSALPSTSNVLYPLDAIQALSGREQLKRETMAYFSLKPGWDGPDSVIPSLCSMETALQLIDYFPAQLPLPRPMLSFDGELGLYWDLEYGYAELSIEIDGEISFFSRTTLGVERFEEGISLSSFDYSWFWRELGHLDATLKMVA